MTTLQTCSGAAQAFIYRLYTQHHCACLQAVLQAHRVALQDRLRFFKGIARRLQRLRRRAGWTARPPAKAAVIDAGLKLLLFLRKILGAHRQMWRTALRGIVCTVVWVHDVVSECFMCRVTR